MISWSLSARRAWIEIVLDEKHDKVTWVALRKESVDRNMRWVYARLNVIAVALRKESVDRNIVYVHLQAGGEVSLSARRAWIEIFMHHRPFCSCVVALRKESVDRNLNR